MAELVRAVAGAALWLSALVAATIMVNRAAGRRPLDERALLVAWPLFLFGGTAGVKLLDLVYRLDAAGTAVVYVVLLGAAVAAARLLPRGPEPAVERPGADTQEDARLVRRIAAVTIGVTAVGLALFSLIAPVHVWDVQAYHMPMVASYVQHGSLDPWPTQDLRQVFRVNGAELQMTALALLARSDAWVELPNAVALVVAAVATVATGRRVLGRETLAWAAAILIVTAPQILLGSVTAKNDIVFMALVLCAFYWMIDLAEQPRESVVPRVVLLAGICALAVATKVLGLNVLGAIGLTLLILVVRRRVPLRLPVLLGVLALIGTGILVGDIYVRNVTQSDAMPVGIRPGEVYYTSGLANVVAAAKYYLLDLSLRRLIVPQDFEHDLSHYGYFFPFLLALGTWAAVRPWVKRRDSEAAQRVLALATAILFASIIVVRQPISWDQRFMIWMVPVFAVLALSLLRSKDVRYVLVVASFGAAFGLGNLFRTFTDASDGLFPRSARYFIAHGQLATLRDVPQDRYRAKIDGYAELVAAAAPTDSILYVGAEDTWMYPAWGPRFTSFVRGVSGPEDAVRQIEGGTFAFVIVEHAAADGLRQAVEAAATAPGYKDLVDAQGRRILVRGGGER